MTEPTFRSDMKVELIDFWGGDGRAVQAARTSTLGASARGEEERAGLINFLWRERHCYDAETEVLTARGWVKWPSVRDDDEFCTVDVESKSIAFQRSSGIIRQEYSGEMVRLNKVGLDLLVTPEHRMLVQERKPNGAGWKAPSFRTANEIGDRAYKIPKTFGYRVGEYPEYAELLGFVLGDAHVTRQGQITFHLRKGRKIAYLKEQADRCGFRVTERAGGDRFGLITDEKFRTLAMATYTPDRKRTVPEEVMRTWSSAALNAFVEGLINSDGHRVPNTNKVIITTMSDVLADQLQMFGGLGARAFSCKSKVQHSVWSKEGAMIYCLRPTTPRSSSVRIGFTRAGRRKEVTKVQYTGTVYCATVPGGTLYVRRNGVPVWSGNSVPFEHSGFTFRIECPIFVSRQLVKHRTTAISEESARYRKLDGTFYVPAEERPLAQAGKTGEYNMVHLGEHEETRLAVEMVRASQRAWASYEHMLRNGAAKEVARMVLPVNVYSSMYLTMNARNLIHFLSLRNEHHAQHEIREVAEKMEDIFAEKMPITYKAWRSDE